MNHRTVGFITVLALIMALSPAPLFCAETAANEGQGSVESPNAEPLTQEPPLTLTLNEAVCMALENNLGLRVLRLSQTAPLSRAEDVTIAESRFDPSFGTGVSYANTRNPYYSNDFFGNTRLYDSHVYTLNTEALLTTKTLSGASVAVSASAARRATNDLRITTANPEYTGVLTFSLKQPLMRNAGIDVNRAAIVVARNDSRVAALVFEESVMELLLNVNRAYWNLVFFREDLKAKDKSLQAAKDFLHNTEIMLQAGAVAKLEVSRAKLRVAERREDVVLAQARIVDAEDQLRYLIYGQGDDLLSPQSLVPADVPSVYAEQINSDEAVNFALAARPVMESQRVALESADVILATAKNQLLPQVDLAATYSLNGLGEDRHDTLYSMKTLDYHDATASLSFSVPLGNRMARSYYTKQRYQRLKALADYAVMERDLTLSVKTAIRGISTSLRSVETNLVRLEASQEQLDVEKQNYDVGRSISLDVLDAQEALQQAESALIASQIAFRLSLAEYYRQTGKILEIHDVIVESDSSITAPDLETR